MNTVRHIYSSVWKDLQQLQLCWVTPPSPPLHHLTFWGWGWGLIHLWRRRKKCHLHVELLWAVYLNKHACAQTHTHDASNAKMCKFWHGLKIQLSRHKHAHTPTHFSFSHLHTNLQVCIPLISKTVQISFDTDEEYLRDEDGWHSCW